MKKSIKSLAVLSLVLIGVTDVNASVDLTLNDPNSGSPSDAYCSYAGLNATVLGNNDITGGQWIGIYSFTVSPGATPPVASPYYGICLSPGGTLDSGTYTYNATSPGSGINPGSWTTTGFQNAAYLFSKYESAIIGNNAGSLGLIGSTQDQGTALALALYAALWNSSASSVASSGGFTINSFGDSSQASDFATMLNNINNLLKGGAVPNEYASVLLPEDANSAGPSGQEFLLLGAQVDGVTVVPESSTVIAGMLLLLPVGASAFRIFRNNKVS